MGLLKTTEKHQLKYKQRYTEFLTHSKRIWVNVLLHREVRRLLKVECNEVSYRDKVIVKDKSPVGSEQRKLIKLKGENLLEFVDSSTGAGSEWMLEWSLASAIGLFEVFINDIAKMAYLEYPERFLVNQEKDTLEECVDKN